MKTFYHNISELITLKDAYYKNGCNLSPEDLSLVKNAALIVDNDLIVWVGSLNDVPAELKDSCIQEINCQQHIITPALVDAHTHLLFAGNRSHEFNMRLNGATYEDIAKAGGGITYTSSTTNQLPIDKLYNLVLSRLEAMYLLGVSACEIKTGYSLTLEGELEQLRLIQKVKNYFKDRINIHATFMPAHAIPTNSNARDYINTVVLPGIQIAAEEKIADSVDVFHEQNYFSTVNTQEIFDYASRFKLNLRLHADELNNNHGASLAARYNALSADHLLKTDAQGAKDLAQAGTIANLLPGTALFLGKDLPPAKLLLQAGCRVAISSDFNPGSCHYNDVFSIARLVAPSLKLNVATFWAAITLNAAHALGLKQQGAIIPGLKAEMLKWETSSTADLLYDWTKRPNCIHL